MEEIKNRQMPEEDAAEQETNASAGTENVGEESGEAKAAGETAENAAGQDSSKESGPAGQEGPGGKEEPSEGASEGKKGFFWIGGDGMDMAAVSMDMHTMQIASQASVSVLKNTMDMAEEISSQLIDQLLNLNVGMAVPSKLDISI